MYKNMLYTDVQISPFFIRIKLFQTYTLKTNVLKTTQPVLYFNTPVCQVKDNTFCVNFNSTSVIFFLTQVDILKIFNTPMCHNDTNCVIYDTLVC